MKLGMIEAPGLEGLIEQVKNLPEDLQKKVSMEIEASCMTIVRNAKRKAPTNLGRLKNLISYRRGADGLSYEIISGANYSAYVEFGTKDNVRVPAGYAEFVQQYQGVNIDGGGMTMKEAIYKWAKDKGIPKKWWYWIYVKIKQQGIKAQPFFIPALVELANLEKRIGKIVNNYTP